MYLAFNSWKQFKAVGQCPNEQALISNQSNIQNLTPKNEGMLVRIHNFSENFPQSWNKDFGKNFVQNPEQTS